MDNLSNTRPSRLINRRDFLKAGGIVGAASVLAACCPPAPQPTAEIAMRIAHITDMHIAPDGGPGVAGFTQALQNVLARTPSVDLILNTGDCVGDALGAPKEWALQEWDAFNTVIRQEVPPSLPIHHAIGNHDVWGWGLPIDQQQASCRDPLFGKGMAVQELGIPDPYSFYTFDQAGWRFLVLDSINRPDSWTEGPNGECPTSADIVSNLPYTGRLDEKQYNWLAHQLAITPSSMPVCVASHIPILCACELLDGQNMVNGIWVGNAVNANWVVPGADVHIDAGPLWTLFGQHKNIKLCLSGHTHQVEDLRYHGVKYLTDGAIAGNWWSKATPAYMDFPRGYVVVNLYTDGSSDSEFVEYT